MARCRSLEIAEMGKSRLLTELVGRGDLLAPPDIPSEQVMEERRLLAKLTELDMAELVMAGPANTTMTSMPPPLAGSLERLSQRRQTYSRLEDVWQSMVQVSPDARDYVALRRGNPLSWKDMTNLAADLGPQTALVSLFTSYERSWAFILRGGEKEPVVVESELGHDKWLNCLLRLSREVHAYDSTNRYKETWDGPLRQLMDQVGIHLAGVARVIFVPHTVGHVIPWTVLARRANWQVSGGQPVLLVTLPALAILPTLRRRPISEKMTALIIGNPLGDLRYAEQEAREIAALLGESALIGQQATKANVMTRLADASIVHLATHAYFSPDSPLDSGIVLADGLLTAREVMHQRLRADLLVLSGCQTGIAGTLVGDELAGLAQAFLQAGTRTLVVSLWAVNDEATATLMSTFYSRRLAGVETAQALSQAMIHIQTFKRWHHPYWWGAFVCMGAV